MMMMMMMTKDFFNLASIKISETGSSKWEILCKNV